MSQGVIYLLDGTKPAARLVVSIVSLRRRYAGPIAILSTDPAAAEIAERIAAEPALAVTHVRAPNPLAHERRRAYLLKTLVHKFTPYDVSLFLDCDTLVRGELGPLFELPSPQHMIVTQFANWPSHRGIVAQRIQRWRTICEPLIGPALTYGRAVNTGVFSFSRQSLGLEQWHSLAYAGRRQFIPDEIAMQLLLPQIPAIMLDDRFNCSPKFGDPRAADVRIVHFHGRKHIGRFGALWMPEYEAAVAANVAGIRDWTPAADRELRRYLRSLQAPTS